MYRTTIAATLLAGAVALGAAAPAVACPPDHHHQGNQGNQSAPAHQGPQGPQGNQGNQGTPHSHGKQSPQEKPVAPGQSAEPIQAHTDPLHVSEPLAGMPMPH
ncbi:hypothetical protein GCM10009801_50150 [Streptomyces albiaxialis]|uniref:Secreted protein n=1 Tax=Streptomyces albiaxialis TaxID=329523 RepID=A0ABN2WBR6_9ACTN